MNRRLLLIVACAVLPSTTLGAQIVQPGEVSADKRAQGNRADKDERKTRKKGAFAGLGFGLGSGVYYTGHAADEIVAQQDWCISACGPLRGSAAKASHSDASSEQLGASSASSHAGSGTGTAGVVALLESLGSASEHALDAMTPVPEAQHQLSTALPHVASSAVPSRAAAAPQAPVGAAGEHPAPVSHGNGSNFASDLHGCVLGCEPPSAGDLLSSPEGAGQNAVVGGALGPAVFAGDVNTIVNPEPSTVVLTLSGLAAMAAIARRKRSVS